MRPLNTWILLKADNFLQNTSTYPIIHSLWAVLKRGRIVLTVQNTFIPLATAFSWFIRNCSPGPGLWKANMLKFKSMPVQKLFSDMASDICLWKHFSFEINHGLVKQIVYAINKETQEIAQHTTTTFRCIFVNEKFRILIWISLIYVPKGPVGNNSALA